MEHLTLINTETDRFITALRQVDAAAPVPTCPAWTADDLLWHLTEVHAFWAEILRTGARTHEESEAIEARKPQRPSDREETIALLIDETAALVAEAAADGGTWLIAGGRWRGVDSETGKQYDEPGAVLVESREPAATITGTAEELYRWLWGRGADGVGRRGQPRRPPGGAGAGHAVTRLVGVLRLVHADLSGWISSSAVPRLSFSNSRS